MHYHFGSKENLYQEAIKQRLLPLGEERRKNFESLRFEKLTIKESLERLISAYISPHLLLCKVPEAHDYMRMMARTTSDPLDIQGAIFSEHIEPTRRLYTKALNEILPDLDVDTTHRLFTLAVGLMVSIPFDQYFESVSGRSAMTNDPESLIDYISVFVSGGILTLVEELNTETSNDGSE